MDNLAIKTHRKRVIKEKASSICLNVVMIALSLVMLYPLIYMILGALSDRSAYLESGLFPVPSMTLERLDNFLIIFRADGLGNALIVTLTRAVFYAVVTTVTSTIGGYHFSKTNFKGKNFLFMYYMASIMIPGVAVMVPNYLILAKFPLIGGNNIFGDGGYGFINNVSVLFITGWVAPYNMFLMRQSFTSLGNEIKEAAEIDGAGEYRIMFQIYLPLVLPIIAVMIIGLFIGHWNDYLTSLIYLPDLSNWHTIGTKIIEIIDRFGMEGYDIIPNYPRIYGISIMFMLPPIICFLCFQNLFVSGLAMGSVKG